MPMKQGRLPKKHIVIRDLKRAPLEIVLKDRTFYGCLINAIIPDRLMAELNPNNPLELDEVHCFNIDQQRWDKFKISELEKYDPNGIENEQERKEDATDPRGTGHQEASEVTQET